MSKTAIGRSSRPRDRRGLPLVRHPVPSPPKLVGALLVVAMAVDYAVTDRYLARGETTTS